MPPSKFIFAIFLFALTACTAAPGARPTAFNYPPTYLKSFPIGSMSEDQMIDKMGPPDKVLDVGGKHRLVYNANQAGNMTYTFIFDNGLVSDVIYNERGGLNGQTARTLQTDKR